MKYLSFGFLFLVISCGSESTETVEVDAAQDTLAVDTIEVAEVVEVEEPKRLELNPTELLAKADTILPLPLVIDSAFVDSVMEMKSTEKALSNAQVQYLGFDMVDNRPTGMAKYCINEFIRIDSLKLKGEYEDYVGFLDIGMTEWATAHVIGKLELAEGRELFLWATEYETMQACPYGHGAYIWATVFVDGQALNTALVGENSGGADAPYWGSTLATSTISSFDITMNYLEESGGDYDEETEEEIVESTQKQYKVKFTIEGGFE